MKKVIAILLCLTFLFTFVACGKEGIDLEEEDIAYADSHGAVEYSGERTAYNYLTGRYDMANDRVGMRPHCISIDNIESTWPQTGISAADIIIEMETEFGISRMMCLFADSRGIDLIGPVRSLRDQFLELVYPLDPMIVHIGYSVLAGRAVAEHSIRTLDGDLVPQFIYINKDRVTQGYATEHTKYTSGKNIAEGMEIAGLDDEAFRIIDSYLNFVEPDDQYTPATGSASQVTFMYSENDRYDGDFRYDEATGKYLKFQRNQAHMDDGNNKQLAFDNVIVILADVSNVDDSGLISVDYQGGGTAYYFSNGSYEEVTWSKGDYSTNIEFTRADGSALEFNTGQTMISVIRDTNADTLVITP